MAVSAKVTYMLIKGFILGRGMRIVNMKRYFYDCCVLITIGNFITLRSLHLNLIKLYQISCSCLLLL